MKTPRLYRFCSLIALPWLAACATEVGIDDDTLADDDSAANDDTDDTMADDMAGADDTADDDDGPPVLDDDMAEPKNPACGDGEYQDGEVCDDGNTTGGDGCAADCSAIEIGFNCTEAGQPCQSVEVCGDGRQTANESCDDGNVTAGDGCTTTCVVEANFACPNPGEPCVNTVECGDGMVSGAEQCDDGGTDPGDGCDATCLVEAGWSCPTAGRPCIAAACGDGIIAGLEECEDGNAVAGDGCNANCQAEIGFVCEAPGQACREAVCGDGVVEGGEPCDDGDDTNTGDGCSPGCILEPNCDNGPCTSACGDGLILPDDVEECDDGNLQPGDGCSAECKVEEGFACEPVSTTVNGTLSLPIVYRDFRASDEQHFPGVAEAHPDFEIEIAAQEGLVEPMLGRPNQQGEVAGKPVYSGANDSIITSTESFNQWFQEVEGVNQTVVSTLELMELGNQPGSFQFSDSSFFPLDNLGWTQIDDPMGNPAEEHRDGNHNFFFTSEVTYWFEYQQSGNAWPTLDFTGDDDVWVFINRQLAVDLGGIHQAQNGSITLDPTAAANLGLDVGKVYEIKVFQAERHTTQSNYRLTLSGFTRVISECSSTCGDGVVTPDEECDDGPDNGPGYGMCTNDCTLGPRCGDGMVDAGNEDCDNGLNLDAYKTSETACAPGCKTPSFCGDGIVDTAFGEVCDDMVNDNSYGGCSPICQLGPRCGDGKVDKPQEQCDEGDQINGDGCDFECQLEKPPDAK